MGHFFVAGHETGWKKFARQELVQQKTGQQELVNGNW